MKNRYDDILRECNQEILSLCPYKPFLFTIGAHEIKRLYKKGNLVLDLGSGEGDSALPILEITDVPLHLLDISSEMVEISKKNLRAYKARTKFICEDAYDYLKDAPAYNIIFEAWTIHNFKQADKVKMIRAIYENLKPGGAFVVLDKVYPPTGKKELLAQQIARYERYMKPRLAKAITAHEIEDASDAYRMDEKPFMKFLKEVGFTSVEIVDRIERDVVLIARK